MNLIKLIGKTVTYLTDVFHYLNRYECCLQRLNHAYLYRGIGAICVQRFDDSLNPAIHITYRVSRRSSSLREPRDPSLIGKSFWFFVVALVRALQAFDVVVWV